MKTMHAKRKLLDDVRTLAAKAAKQGYALSAKDVFALGYMCGKYGVQRLLDNEAEVVETCWKYDETDDLMLLDTVAETLMDLNAVKRETVDAWGA